MPSSQESLRLRLESLRGAPAFQNYLQVRDRVLRVKDLETGRATGVATPSAYWREELANFEYMLDASPLVIDKLRHHTYHVTGLKVYDYRSHKDRYRQQIARKLKALRKKGDRELLVPEPEELGGFGFEIDGDLYNIDTLKFYEVLIALDKGAVLSGLRDPDGRRLVWEIGAGWGGFPYQFKKLCPDVTYVIMDFPELFLFSAVYLMTLFPDARVAFHDEGALSEVMADWRELDFIFVSNVFLDQFDPERLDLTINMVSFQEMTTEQVQAYVDRAYELESPYLYSLNRDRSPYNPELSSVSEIIESRFWPHEIPVLPVSYTKMLDKVEKMKRIQRKTGKRPQDYRHIVGWRRVRT